MNATRTTDYGTAMRTRDNLWRRPAGIRLFPLLIAAIFGLTQQAIAQQAGVDEIAPSIISSGGEIQQGEFGEMFQTVGEPIIGDSTALDGDGSEVTWTGFWNLVPSDTLAGVTEEWTTEGAGAHALTTVAPNPFTERLTIYVRLASPANVKLVAYDLTGREVLRLIDGHRQQGTTRLQWGPVDIEAGSYLMQLEVDGTLYPGVRVAYTP